MTDVSLSAERDASRSAGATARLCEWCRGPIPAGARRDAICCSTRCRQARHRFMSGRTVRSTTSAPVRLGYADPPYLGCCGLYDHFHGDGGCWDDLATHAALIGRLVDEFPDGWALSCSAASLPALLKLCPDTVRVASWHRGERPARSFGPLNGWEPVIFHGGRGRESSAGPDRRVDVLEHVARPRLTDPDRVIGAKPAAFCYWLFDLLGALPGDEFVDLFAGSGGVARAWRYYADGAPVAAAAATDPSCSDHHGDPSCPPADTTDRSDLASADASRPAAAQPYAFPELHPHTPLEAAR